MRSRISSTSRLSALATSGSLQTAPPLHRRVLFRRQGGGSGRHGALLLNSEGPSPVPDYDAIIQGNRNNGLSLGIIRNRHNVQWTLGAISKFAHDLSENVRLEAGLDWRTAEIQHFSTVRDLLGGSGYLRFDNDFWGPEGRVLKLGERF